MAIQKVISPYWRLNHIKWRARTFPAICTWFQWHTFSKEKIFQWVSRLCCCFFFLCSVCCQPKMHGEMNQVKWRMTKRIVHEKNERNLFVGLDQWREKKSHFWQHNHICWKAAAINQKIFLFWIQEYRLINASWRIDWPGSEKPIDQPICGFNNELCPKDDTHITSMVIAGALALMLFCSTGELHNEHCFVKKISQVFIQFHEISRKHSN